MVDPQTTLGEQLLDLAIAERKAQVPADREQDHLRLKLAPLEQSGNRWDTEHPSILAASLSGQAFKVATLPYRDVRPATSCSGRLRQMNSYSKLTNASARRSMFLGDLSTGSEVRVPHLGQASL